MATKRSYCVPCKEGFDYPSKYRQHIASRPHILFVESLFIRQSMAIYTQRTADNEQHTSNEDEFERPLPVHTDELKDEEMDFGEDSELEDLIEEIREQSNESYYPFPPKIFTLLYLLVNSPHPMGESNLSFVWVDLILLAIFELFYGNRWHTDLRFYSPMVMLADETSVFVNDCVSFYHPTLGSVSGKVTKFFHQVVVPTNSIHEIATPPSFLVRWIAPVNFVRMDEEETLSYFLPHPLKLKAAGKRIVIVPFTAPQHLVCRVVQSLHTNHMQMSIIEVFICRRLHMNTSMILICIWLLCKPIAQQLTMLETDGVVVFDALNQEEVLVVAPVLCIVCDNPMASKNCNHLGSSALKYCRLCMVERTGDPYVICEKRCKCRAVEQMSEIKAQRTEDAKVEKRNEYGLREDDNPLLDIPADIYNESLPVEVLHTLELGACKYLLKETMPTLRPWQKREILARVRAFNTSGFRVKMYGKVCQYYQSFWGRDFKAWAQMAIFILKPYLNERQAAVWLSISKLFQIAYCEFFDASKAAEWQSVCQGFVDADKQHMPSLLQKPKTHMILHLVQFVEMHFKNSFMQVRNFNATIENLQGFTVALTGAATEEVVGYGAIVSQDSSLVNCGDYIQLVTQSSQIQYGILLAVLRTSSGAVLCLVQGFDSLQAPGGQTMLN
eukprot:Em0007g1260a